MTRILFWLILFGAVWAAIVFARRNRTRRELAERQSENVPAQKPSIDMIECPVCKTNFPETEAVCARGRKYCSDRCRDRDGFF